MIQKTSPSGPDDGQVADNRGQPDTILTPPRVLVLPGSQDDLTPPRSDTSEVLVAEVVEEVPVDWQTAMRRAIRSGQELRERLQLPASAFPGNLESFPTFVPLEFLQRITPGDLTDPLLRQVLPVGEELNSAPDFVADPVGDLDALAAGGLIHKYEGRALLIVSAACGVHCRYCFRREFPYSDAGSRRENWAPAIEYIQSHRDIEEVILSGGDPLTLTDGPLFELLDRLDAIAHVRRIRFHTRMPIVIPQRVTPAFCQQLQKTRAAIWFVVHANHVNELDSAVLERLEMLRNAGIPVLNQAVLLRGVNDDEQALVDLFMKLVNHRVQPYYLHQLDRVRGAQHFEVPVERGLELIANIRTRLPGYAVPTYVSEQAGHPSKTPL